MQQLSSITDEIEKNKDELEYLPTGFKLFDDFMDGGFLPKELIVIGAASGLGKSYFSGQIFTHIASKGFNSAYFSLEISNQMIVSRMIGSLCNIKPNRIMTGLLLPEEHQKRLEAKCKLSVYENYMFFYDDVYELDQLKKEIAENKYEFAVVDFLQNVEVKNLEEYSRLSTVIHELQKLAKQTKCCILAISQLSNSVIRDTTGGFTEFKGSGEINTCADLSFYLKRENIIDPSASFNEFTLELKKNRRGFTKTEFKFNFQYPGGWISEVPEW